MTFPNGGQDIQEAERLFAASSQTLNSLSSFERDNPSAWIAEAEQCLFDALNALLALDSVEQTQRRNVDLSTLIGIVAQTGFQPLGEMQHCERLLVDLRNAIDNFFEVDNRLAQLESTISETSPQDESYAKLVSDRQDAEVDWRGKQSLPETISAQLRRALTDLHIQVEQEIKDTIAEQDSASDGGTAARNG